MEFLLNHCQMAFQSHGGLLATLFLGGLVGSFTHCAGMCGPFVLAQTASTDAGKNGVLARARGLALIPYHLGRMTTYMALGILAASMSGLIISTPVQRGVAAVMLGLAALIFLSVAAPGFRLALVPEPVRKQSRRLGSALGRLAAPFFGSPTVFHRYALGLVLGFLPCGLLAAALMAVAATAEPLAAALGMAAFCAGTVPALFLVGSGGRLAKARWPQQMTSVVRGVMVFNALSLFVMAGSMVF